MATLDLRQDEDREIFSQVQFRGFLRLAERSPEDMAEATGLIRDICQRAKHARSDDDRVSRPGTVTSTLPPLCADAVAYVALGSQLGMTVLRNSLDPLRRTGIFEHEPDIASWKLFADRTSRINAGSEATRQTVEDARTAFRIFYVAAQETMNFPPEES